jgi:hypothetical protein
MNSIANIHKVFFDTEEALKTVGTTFSNDAGEIVEAFATFSDNKKIKVTLDIFAFLFASTSTLTWTKSMYCLLISFYPRRHPAEA